MLRVAVLAGLLLHPAASFADKASAETCAAELPAEAKLIYHTVLPHLGSSDNRATIAEVVRDLVRARLVSSASARDSATLAGRCLRLLR